MTLPGVSVELAAAIRRVNAEYRRLPEPRPSLAESWTALEADLDRFAATGDRDQSLVAIERWAATALRQIGVDP